MALQYKNQQRKCRKNGGSRKETLEEENEGFNRQKNWQGDITHACSWNDQSQKNHYLMEQISDL